MATYYNRRPKMFGGYVKLKVAILAKTITPWQNGNLLYEEALRQGRDVLLVKQENTLSDIYIALSQYEPDFILLTGSRKKHEPYKIAKSVAPVAIWDADNAEAIMALGSLYYSNLWTNYWAKQRAA